MNNQYFQYNYKGSELMAVPAVHHQSAFAIQVHNICSNPDTMPDAIVVELGHAVVIELVKFLKKLKQGNTKKETLPCMLGLMMRNNYIHPDYYEKTLLLQDLHCKPIYNLPDDILSDRLNFAKWSTLFISPADSIIEAVRCAIELNIPVYGLDMADFANTRFTKYSIEDPQSAHNNVVAYSNRLLKYGQTGRDLHIDLNREVFMAAGLKYCLSKHKKLLFTCGLAHWKSIVSFLDDPTILPFPAHKRSEKKEIQRVLIDPALAASVMEIIPQITFEYESRRCPVTKDENNFQFIDSSIFVRNCLDETYKKYSEETESRDFNLSGSAQWSNIELYEQYLFQLSAVRQRKIPDTSTLISAAEVMMNEEFCRILTQQIMRVSPQWSSSRDFPALPVLSPSGGNKKNINKNNENRRVRKSVKKKFKSKEGNNEEQEFFVSMPETSLNDYADVSYYWKGPEQKNEKESNYYHMQWIWPPCESLLFGIAFKAAGISNTNQNRFSGSKTFDGSMEGGIDVKATIRSIVRGERKKYVNKLESRLEQSINDGVNPDPFVIIFQKSRDIESAYWKIFQAGVSHVKYLKDQEIYHDITMKYGHTFVSSVTLEEEIEIPEHLIPVVSTYFKLSGTVLFGNPCINEKQSSIWLESAGYKCCPVLFSSGITALLDYYKENFKLDLTLSDWQQSLIRMAIPFAKKSVTIIAYDNFLFSEQVKTEAERKKILLNLVGYAVFSESQLEEARHRFSIQTIDEEGNQFPPETENLLGQTKDTYLEMLPYAIRRQVGCDEKRTH